LDIFERGYVEMEINLRRMLVLSSILLALGVALKLPSIVTGSLATTVAIDPLIAVKAPNELFNVTLTVAEVSELYFWELNLTFNPLVLEAVSYFEGPFLNEAFLAQDTDTWPLEPKFNNTAGWVAAGCSPLPPTPEHGASGSGTLGYVTFKAKTEGKSVLHFADTKLRSWNATMMEMTQIAHTSSDSLFQYPLLRDIAVTGVISSSASVQAGQSVTVNVTLKNKGNVSETFNVNLSYGTTLIDTRSVTSLEPDSLETVNFIWDTKNVAPGSYTLTATALAVSGETNTEDNTDSSVVVNVTAAPPVLPLEWIAAIIVIIVIGLGAGIYYFRKRK